jgi:hypothetical protein
MDDEHRHEADQEDQLPLGRRQRPHPGHAQRDGGQRKKPDTGEAEGRHAHHTQRAVSSTEPGPAVPRPVPSALAACALNRPGCTIPSPLKPESGAESPDRRSNARARPADRHPPGDV